MPTPDEIRRQTVIDNRVRAHLVKLGVEPVLRFRVWSKDLLGNTGPVVALEETAIGGQAIIVATADKTIGGEASRDYISPVVSDPTWLDIAVLANDALLATGDRVNVFLQALKHERLDIDGVPVFSLSFGAR